jgi:hypothetical protein
MPPAVKLVPAPYSAAPIATVLASSHAIRAIGSGLL